MTIHNAASFAMVAGLLVVSGAARADGTVCGAPAASAQYELQFVATWSFYTHPQEFPYDNPHFTGPVGGTHHDAISIWEIGGIATQGIETVAERGVKDDLIAEVEMHIQAGDAGEVISGIGIFPSPGQRTTSFTATQTHPLASVVSMVAPSPDWFVGVSAVALFRDGAWIDEMAFPLYIMDAGTDAGKTYRTPDMDLTPHIPVSMIDGYPLRCGSLGLYPTPYRPVPCMSPGQVLPVGSFTFRRITPATRSCESNPNPLPATENKTAAQ